MVIILVVCAGITFVPFADAAEITLDMIHSKAPAGCVLVAMYCQTLNKHQQKSGMYEIETFAHVVCHRKSHKFVNESSYGEIHLHSACERQ